MGSVERRKKKIMKNDVCWCVWAWKLVFWCVWAVNWCVGACGLVNGVLVCVGW